MKLINNKIYSYAIALNEAFADSTQRLPMKINFYLQKNKAVLTTLAQDIEQSRADIVRTYGVADPENPDRFSIPADKVAEAQQELTDLLNLEQEVNIYMISMDSLSDDISLTTAQMEAMMFMIE